MKSRISACRAVNGRSVTATPFGSRLEARTQVGFELQDLMNLEPTSIGVLYPDQYWAFRKASYTNWIDSPGYGVVHKWSFLPASAVPAGLRAAE
jgi:hypothetical protein